MLQLALAGNDSADTIGAAKVIKTILMDSFVTDGMKNKENVHTFSHMHKKRGENAIV
jgi:hypothetical protein